jgi:Uncharacterized protein conserved in bacteria
MEVSNKLLIVDFCRKHARAVSPFIKWMDEVNNAELENHAELKQLFPHADYIGNGRYVFNISGNKFRLIALVLFIDGVLDVRFVGTHAEYDKLDNCSEL